MKITSAVAVILVFIIVLVTIFGCAKEDLTGNAVKAAVSDSESSASSTSSGIGTSEEGEEGCTIDNGLPDRIFSGKSPL